MNLKILMEINNIIKQLKENKKNLLLRVFQKEKKKFIRFLREIEAM